MQFLVIRSKLLAVLTLALLFTFLGILVFPIPKTLGVLVYPIQMALEPVLESEGSSMADSLISRLTPGCKRFESLSNLELWSTILRESLLKSTLIDLGRMPVSSQIQREHKLDRYTIHVVRLEVHEDIYMPINVYIPTNLDNYAVPLVITPTGCESATWSPHVQRRAGNLAALGMVTIVTEGFCHNGARAMLIDSNPNVGYARQMVGLPGDVTVYLQELVTTITWALNTYEFIDPAKIGVAGYSYGGHMAMFLAHVDARINSVSVPATYLGTPCDDTFELNSDIWLESENRDHVWSSPLEISVVPVNSRIVRIYPRALHTTSGFKDWGAHPNTIGKAMAYARYLYSLGNHEDNLLYRTDQGDHNYGQSRREDTYEWLAYSLLDNRLVSGSEKEVVLLTPEDLRVDISGTKTLKEELDETISSHVAQRLHSGKPANRNVQIANTIADLFPAFTPEQFTVELIWKKGVENIDMTAYRFSGSLYSFPVFQFDSGETNKNKRLLYLPQAGTRKELEEILGFLRKYDTVISIDYLGIGELKSNRLLLHSFSRYFMHNDPSLPKMNVNVLRSYLSHVGELSTDVYGNGWASSFYTTLLKWLEPQRVSHIYLAGVPESEFEYLKTGNKIPDLLLWGGIYSKLSIAELTSSFDSEDVTYRLEQANVDK